MKLSHVIHTMQYNMRNNGMRGLERFRYRIVTYRWSFHLLIDEQMPIKNPNPLESVRKQIRTHFNHICWSIYTYIKWYLLNSGNPYYFRISKSINIFYQCVSLSRSLPLSNLREYLQVLKLHQISVFVRFYCKYVLIKIPFVQLVSWVELEQ